MFKFCPSCASQNIAFEQNRVFRCPDCGLVYFQNTAAATGCIIAVPDGNSQKIMFLVRNKEPSKGKLDLPGGFVDPGEGVLEGLFRELQEEIGWTPPIPESKSLSDVFTLFASFPNKYLYKNILYNTCDIYFYVCAPELNEKKLALQEAEVSGIKFLSPHEINYDDIAFESTRRAVKVYLEKQII